MTQHSTLPPAREMQVAAREAHLPSARRLCLSASLHETVASQRVDQTAPMVCPEPTSALRDFKQAARGGPLRRSDVLANANLCTLMQGCAAGLLPAVRRSS